MNVIAVTALHYGCNYLGYAINSVIDAVDEYHVLYSPHGSHGALNQYAPPPGNSEHELRAIAQRVAGDKLRWHTGEWIHEGQQRDTIYQLAPNADVVLTVDYDEIWNKNQAEAAIRYALNSHFRGYRIPMIHYWRSFHKAILHDPAYPVRVVCPKRDPSAGETTINILPINHLGYAIPSDLLQYKMHIHGHRAEWRKDIDWFSERWCNPDATDDLHPVGSDQWNYERVNPLDNLPSWMRLHPFYGMETIE